MDSGDTAPAVTYRLGPPTQFGVLGAMLLIAFGLIAWMMSRDLHAATPFLWGALAFAFVFFVYALGQRFSRRASEEITLDDSGITTVRAGRLHTLRWELIGTLNMGRAGLEMSDSNHFIVVTLPRQLEDFRGAVKNALTHLESAYALRSSGARSRPSATDVTFTLSVRPQIWQLLGLLSTLAASAWVFINIRLLAGGVAALPLALWNLGRTAYAVTVGPTVKVETMLGTREVPITGVREITLEADTHGKPVVVIQDVYGERVSIALPDVPGRQLELYDRLRRLTEARAGEPGIRGIHTQIAPMRAALLSASGALAVAIIFAGSVATGELLRFSSQLGLLRPARIAIAMGSPLNMPGLERGTPLYIAAKFGRVSSVELLLTSGADPVKPWGKAGFTPLHVAAQEGYVENVRLLLRAGVDPDVRNKLKQTALWQVSWQRHQRVVEIANVLIDAGANVDAADTDGWTPLHMAVRHDNRALLESLIRRGANVGARTNRGNTALSLAIIEERHEALRVMMKAGANVNVSNGSDYAPLQTAVWRGEVALVDMLLKHGADANAAVNPVDLPLYLAIQRGHTEIARVLLNAGAKWDVEADGWTAIQRAAREGNVAMVQELIYRGANPTTPSSVAPPALLIAAESGQLPVVSMLVESGIDPNLRWHNWSALRIAGTRKHYPVVDYLRAHGAN